jgi:hypothetical protein
MRKRGNIPLVLSNDILNELHNFLKEEGSKSNESRNVNSYLLSNKLNLQLIILPL